MSTKSTFFFLLATCYFLFGVSEGADTSTSGGVITDFITKTPDYAGDSVTTGNATAENGTTSVLKIVDNVYSFVRYPIMSRFHTWFLSSKIRKVVNTIFLGSGIVIFVAVVAIALLVILGLLTCGSLAFAIAFPFISIGVGFVMSILSIFY
ncbi:hypothetical protein C0J52_07219 [Blattella germanica]|nr:hypothetical protein C0J52_07219 [Blattella germanica]